jgi:molybdate transport system ATP-binding protein
MSYGTEKGKKIALPQESEETLTPGSEALIAMKDTTVRYGDLVVIDGLNWAMQQGENWAILGPNGAGKSTLVKLILGENLQAYANPIFLFGKRRGSGETIWEIKKRMGVVSQDLQIQYRKKMGSNEVIASGFYDSIGLYQAPTREQKEAVERWVDLLDIQDLAREPYHQLSFGQKRMVLLARAMVKNPVLLIADEPCHGLDVANRKRVLEILERIGQTKTSLLYITDRPDEILGCITHVMRLQKGKAIQQGRKNEVLPGGGNPA